MALSHNTVQQRPKAADERQDANISAGPADNPWRDAAILLAGKIRRSLGAIALSTLIGAGLAGTVKSVMPAKYKVSAQILIDPQLEARQQSASEAQNSTLDANAAINYVESQMGVIRSERVMLRVIRDQGLAGDAPRRDGDAPEGPEAQSSRELLENRALLKLQKAVEITRAERSFLVNITVTDTNPEKAAGLANALVKSYGEINAVDRTAGAKRMAMDLANRVEDMRKALQDSEARLQAYKVEHNLVGVNDKSIVERQASEATDSLAAAEKAESQARARLHQLESSPNDIGAVSSFGADPESRQLQVLIVGRAATAAEVEQLESTLGEHHPALIAARTRLRDYNQRINASLDGLRRTARAQIAEAQAQTAAAQKRLAAAAAGVGRAREADAPLRELEDSVDSKRKTLTELELRQRQTGDGSRVDGGGFRVVSPARVPNVEAKTTVRVLWSLFGGLIGAALAIAYLAVSAVFEPVAPEKVLHEDFAGIRAGFAAQGEFDAVSRRSPGYPALSGSSGSERSGSHG